MNEYFTKNERYHVQVLNLLLKGGEVPVYELTKITHRFAVPISTLRAKGYVIETIRHPREKGQKQHFSYKLVSCPA